MLEQLMNINPSLYNQCIEFLEEVKKRIERKYNASPNSYGYRFFKPDDAGMMGDYDSYSARYTNYVDEGLFAKEGRLHVPTSRAWVYLGWFCGNDLGMDGYLKVKKEGVLKSHLDAQMVFNQQLPKHFFLDVQHFIVFYENDICEFIIRNESSIDELHAKIFPILYVFDSRMALSGTADNGSTIDIKHAINSISVDNQTEQVSLEIQKLDEQFKKWGENDSDKKE